MLVCVIGRVRADTVIVQILVEVCFVEIVNERCVLPKYVRLSHVPSDNTAILTLGKCVIVAMTCARFGLCHPQFFEQSSNLSVYVLTSVVTVKIDNHQGETPAKIKIYEGREQCIDVFFETLDEAGKTMEFFGSADEFINLITWQTEESWIKKRVEKGIHINVLLMPGPDAALLESTDEGEMCTTKIFKGTLPFITGFMLYANKVIIWQPRAPLIVKIEDEYIVQMLRSIFNEMWKREG